jgi:hypothetical protein
VTDEARSGHPPDSAPVTSPRWKRRQRDAANIVWISFLTASAATMVFFSMVDPDVLSGYNTLGWQISRQTGYAFGFFGFWALTALASFLSVFLVRTETRRKKKRTARRIGADDDGS